MITRIRKSDKPMKRKDVLRPKSLGKLVQKWARKLGLGYWEISIAYVAPDAFNKEGRQGQVEWTADKRSAHIMILDPLKCLKEHLPKLNIEVTVVHELLHLALCCFCLDGHRACEIQEEHFVDKMSCLLVKMDKEHELAAK